jgi:PAS domain S-box-containing protein
MVRHCGSNIFIFMITASDNRNHLYFLSGGGEMGRLTRDFDWASTSLGVPEQWPQSLRTTVGLVLNSAFPMFLFWGEEMVCFYNDAFRPSLGIDGKHPALGKKGKEVWEEIWHMVGSLLSGVLETGKPVYIEDQLVPFYRNGKIEDIYWTYSYSPVYGNDGTINGILATCMETTEKIKKINEHHIDKIRMQQTEQRIRSLVESAPFPIGVYIGREMRIELANQTMIDVWGKGCDVIGKLYSEILPELDNQLIFGQLDGVYATGIPFHARNQRVDLVVNNKLQPFYFNYSFTPLYDAEGKVYGVMNTAAEVTDLHLAKQKVEQSEKNFRNMILQAPVAMCILLGPSHIIEVANDSMIALWGKEKENVINKPVFEALPDAREQGLEQILSNVYTKGETFTASEHPVVLFRNGVYETVYQNFVYEPYRDIETGILGVLAITTDVTPQVLARRQIEELVAERTRELELVNNNLQKSNAELAQFAHIASHDLQEPLRKISTFIQLLESRIGENIDEQSKTYLSKISASSVRMHTLIRDVLTYSELVKEAEIFLPVDLRAVIENVLTDFELLIEQKQATIRFENLPVIEAIPLQMAQLFGNLVSNSLKFARKDQNLVLTVSSEFLSLGEKAAHRLMPTLDYYRIRFSDNGIGFKEEYADKIFNIFQRLHGKTEYAGTGIGLAMCKKIALNHHGNLNADGSSENGAVFNVILPAKQNA